MKIIIVDQKHGDTRALVLKSWMKVGLTFCLLGLPVLLGYYGYQFSAARNGELHVTRTAQAWSDTLAEQEEQVEKLRADTRAQLQALTLRMANLQARLMRLDALGERLTAISDLDNGEFDFSDVPGMGGPSGMGGPEISIDERDSDRFESLDLMKALDVLSIQIEDRQQQLEILGNLLSDRNIESNTFLAGRPVRTGWISSPFGRRIDPFTGALAWHEGVDFATGEAGVEVEAVASGVVTFAGVRNGYGLMVKINHGNGYESVYAHDQEVLVQPGDIVKKGQVIALSGSSGRSTGPHVHFEIHKNGRVIDPASYIRRTNR